jgi:hypothetical protein
MNSSYLAGFVDGEGHIGFTKTRSVYYPRVLIVNTNLELLEDIKFEYGGCISRLSRIKDNWKIGYQLGIGNRACVNFLEHIADDLIIKHGQALLVFAWDMIRPGKGRKWTNENWECMKLLLAQAKWLNERGSLGQTEVSPIDAELGWSRDWK